MAATTARNKQDVDNLTRSERLWDSLDYTYGVKGERLGKEYDKAYSQADNQLLSRGMQRSSYGAQTLANINKQRIDALDDNQSALIADYENRLTDLEQQDIANDQWERQFAENQRQFDVNLGYQKERDAVSDNQWNMSFNYQQDRDKVADNQWQMAFDKDTDQSDRDLAAGYVSSILSAGGMPSDSLLARAGLSRADAEAMRQQILAGNGTGGYGGGGRSGSGGYTEYGPVDDDYYNRYRGNGTATASTGSAKTDWTTALSSWTPPANTTTEKNKLNASSYKK